MIYNCTVMSSIKTAVNKIVQRDAKGVPNSGRVTYQLYPNGGTVRLAPGLYKGDISLPGMVTLEGAGPDTVIEGKVILEGTEVGGPGSLTCNGVKIRNLAIVNDHGNAIESDSPVIDLVVEDVQICSSHWGVYLNSYTQGALFHRIRQMHPGYGGVYLNGNNNTLCRYEIVGDCGGPKFVPYKSPWEEEEKAMLDLRGEMNVMDRCHVEFNSHMNPDESPKHLVLSAAFRHVLGGRGVERECWFELWSGTNGKVSQNLGFNVLVDALDLKVDFPTWMPHRAINGGKVIA